MNISDWLRSATKRLKDIGIESPRLDAELILAETLRKPRTYLHAHLDEDIDPRRIDIAEARLDLRKDRVPIAYIIGHKEFYGREFHVTPSVLIPRPESEDIVTTFLDIAAGDIAENLKLLDVGTGSGCLGITLKLERPDISVTLSDTSRQALLIAEKNADQLGASVQVKQQSLLRGQVERLNYIVANLPYVDREWQVSPELQHEPQSALFAEMCRLGYFVQADSQVMAVYFYTPIFFLLCKYANATDKEEEALTVLERQVREFCRIYRAK